MDMETLCEHWNRGHVRGDMVSCFETLDFEATLCVKFLGFGEDVHSGRTLELGPCPGWHGE
jgi:hypothetical protein